MVDGETTITDHELTESNREIIKTFVNNLLIEDHHGQWSRFVKQKHFTEHNPNRSDDISDWKRLLSPTSNLRHLHLVYLKCHCILAEGNFVLSVCEGQVDATQSSFFDLFRLENGNIVEHWDTVEAIPPVSDWKNSNGKF